MSGSDHNNEHLASLLALAEKAARLGGEILRQWRGRVTAREKAPADLVTEADLASQRAIFDMLRREAPEMGFVGEESGDSRTTTINRSEITYPSWIVDPLDGTTNFVHGLPGWCVSIGLWGEAGPQLGCIYDPITDDCYSAIADQGAFCNGQSLQTSKTTKLSEALVAVSLPAGVDRESTDIKLLVETLLNARGFRRLGSAALNLCHLASGRLDGYWAASVQPWDVAAGSLIVQEAGGIISDLQGKKLDIWRPKMIAAATDQLHGELVTLFSEFDKDDPPNSRRELD